MLAPNSILNQGRYRVASCFWSNASHSLYEAHDSVYGQHVVICEGPDPRASGVRVFDKDADTRQFLARFNRLKSLSHEALIGVRDHFYHADRKYLVSDAVDGTSICQLAALRSAPVSLESVVAGLERIVDAYSRFANASGNIRYFGTDPGSIRITRDGELRFLYFGDDDAAEYGPDELENTPKSALSFMPLETLWPRLDIASQKVISNNYDERSLEVLESPPDFRSDMFVLGSAAYFLLTGRIPVGALERSIEVLDGYPDPLQPVHVVEPTVSIEISEFIAKSMNLYRQDRFDSFATISRQLAALVSDFSEQAKPANDEVNLDESDLLEIPGVPVATPVKFAHASNGGNGVSATATANSSSDFEIPEPEPVFDRFGMPVRPRNAQSEDTAKPEQLLKSEIDELFEEPVNPTRSEYDDLLEPTKTATPAIPAKPFIPESEPRVALPEPVFERPVFEPKPSLEADLGSEADLFDDLKPYNAAWAKPALIAAAILLILGIGSWMLYSYSGSDDQSSLTPVDTVDTKAATSTEPAAKQVAEPLPDATSPANEVPNNEVKQEPVRTETVREPAPEVPSQAVKPRQVAPEPKQKVESKPATAQVPVKQKKKITVEDLINDN